MISRILLACFLLVSTAALAAECPPAPPKVAPGCKVITVNPAEELSLLGPNNILDSATWARRMELESVTKYWREKLRDAPAGEAPTKPKE